MLRDCIVDANGKIINIGEWDYQYTEIGGQQVAQNPLPAGAVTEQRDIVEALDGSLVEVGYVDPDKALIDAINGATTLAELQAALVGGVTNARVRGKRI